MIVSADEARDVALRHLRSEVEPSIGEELATTDAWEYPTCWVVGYNTRAYLETGSISHALAGGGPLIINRATGRVRMGTWSAAIEDQLDDQ
ncbi:MAG: YrhB domain-containing protein [Trebonia sp.]